MSFEWWWNNEISEVRKTKVDLTEVSTREVEKESSIIKQIKQIEIGDRENDLQELDLLEKQLDGWLDKEHQIKEIQLSLYEKLAIDIDTWKNPEVTQFVKWVIDWLVINNLEEIQTLIDSSLDELIDMLKSLFDIEVLTELVKQTIAEFSNIWNIMENPYNWGIALWTLWLWWLGKLLKWLKIWNKTKDISNEYELYKMKGRDWQDFTKEWPNFVWKEIWDFADSINISELLKDKTKFNSTLLSIDKINEYITNNLENIIKLDNTKLNNFKDNISVLRKKIDNLLSNKELSQKNIVNLNLVYLKLNKNFNTLLNK